MFLDISKQFRPMNTAIDFKESRDNFNIFISDNLSFDEFYTVNDFNLTKLHYYTTLKKVRVGASLFENDIAELFAKVEDAFSFSTVLPTKNPSNKNIIFDLTATTKVISTKSRIIRQASIKELIDNLKVLAKDTYGYKNLNVIYCLNNNIDYEDSYMKSMLLTAKQEMEVTFDFNLFFVSKSIDAATTITRVSQDGIPFNNNKMISVYKMQAASSLSLREIKASKTNEKTTGLNQEDSERVKVLVEKQNVTEKMLKNAVDAGLIDNEDLHSDTEKNAMLIKSISNALSDSNTIQEIKKYDEELLDKVVKKIDRKGLEKYIADVNDSKLVTTKQLSTDNTADSFTENKVPTSRVSEIRKQYHDRMLKKDIASCVTDLSNHPTYPLTVEKIEFTDTKETLNYTTTVTITALDPKGKTVSIKLDIPLLTENKTTYLLEGTRYVLNNQLVSKPILKVKEDTVAITTNYNKWFIYRFGDEGAHTKTSKLTRFLSEVGTDVVVTARNNGSEPLNFTNIETDAIGNVFSDILFPDNRVFKLAKSTGYDKMQQDFQSFPLDRKVIAKYEVVGSDYKTGELFIIDSSSNVSSITKDGVISDRNSTLIDFLIDSTPDKILKKPSRSMYSRVNVVGQKIPLIIALMVGNSLKTILSEYKTKFRILEPDAKVGESNGETKIKLANAILIIETNTVEKQLLFNGLSKLSAVEKFTLQEFFAKNANKVLAENMELRVIRGIENSLRNMIDPITFDILEKELLPTDILNVCLYANTLLRDSKFKKANDFTSYRLRGEETFPAMIYRFLKQEQDKFSETYKRNPRVTMKVNQSQLMRDVITSLPNFSTFNSANQYTEMNEVEKIGYTGFLGLNNSDSLTLDLRSPDVTQEGIIDVNAIVDSSKSGAIKYGTMNINVKNLRGDLGAADTDDFSSKLSYSGSSEPFVASRADASRVA